MRLAATTWTVLVGLMAAGTSHAWTAEDPEALSTLEPGAPLWSICHTFTQPAGRAHGDTTHEERPRGGIRIRLPAGSEPGTLETRAELPAGLEQAGTLGHCVPWGPGITGASSGSLMSASDRDDEEIPICLEGAQCSPVTPKRPTSSITFTMAKALVAPATVATSTLGLSPLPEQAVSDPCAGYPPAPFEPPRASDPA